MYMGFILALIGLNGSFDPMQDKISMCLSITMQLSAAHFGSCGLAADHGSYEGRRLATLCGWATLDLLSSLNSVPYSGK